VTKSPTRPTGSSGTPRKGPEAGKAAENKAAEGKAAEGKAAENKASSVKGAESKSAPDRTAPAKAPDSKASQSKAGAGPTDAGKPPPSKSPETKTAAAPGPQPSPAVTRNPERVARAKAGASGVAAAPEAGAQTSNLVVAGLVGGLLAGAAFIAYDLFLRPAPDTDTRLAAIESRIGELSGDLAPPALPDDLAARLDALESQADEALTTAREAAERPIPDPADMPDVPVDAISANTSTLDALRGDVSALQNDLGSVQDDIAALQGTVSGLQAEVPMDGRIAAATRASAADYILGALSEGRPYAQALAVLRGQNVSSDALAPLEAFAENGAPRLYVLAGGLAAELAGEAPPSGPAVTEPGAGQGAGAGAGAGEGAGAGFLQLFVDRAITVERVDAPRRDVDTGAAQGVIAALESGDAEAALAAWQALPADVQAQAPGFGETLGNLAAARAAALDIAQTALTALANGR
jgi:hypothetical protein